MKFIFIVTIVSAFGLSLAGDFVNPGRKGTRPDEPTFNAYTVIEYLLVVQYEKRAAEIFDALKDCNQSFSIPYRESVELFVNSAPGVERITNNRAKCLINCVMRKTGVVNYLMGQMMEIVFFLCMAEGVLTDAGLQVDEYMKQVKQLQLNYTSYDVNTKSKQEKEQVLETIRRIASKPKSYEIIQSYEMGANECKDRKEPDDCETAWAIARCIIDKLSLYNAPFYPASLDFLESAPN